MPQGVKDLTADYTDSTDKIIYLRYLRHPRLKDKSENYL